MDPAQQTALEAYAGGQMTALELRRRLGGASFGEVVSLLGEAGLSFPRAPVAGREAQIERARAWMFPKHDA